MYYSLPKRVRRPLFPALGPRSRPHRGSPSALNGRAPLVRCHEMFHLSCPEGSVGRFRLEECVTGEHPDRAIILPWVKYVASNVYELPLLHARGASVEQPFYPAAFAWGEDTQLSAGGVS